MDKPDNPLSRRDFVRVLGGALVVSELGIVAGCGEDDPAAQPGADPLQPAGVGAPPAVTQGSAGSGAPITDGSIDNGGTAPVPAGAAQAPSTQPASEGQAPGSDDEPAAADPADGPMASDPAAAPDDGKSKIYVIKASDRTDGILQALAMFGGLGFAAGRDVVIKPNYNSQYAFPATTHNDTLRAVVAELQAVNAGAITLAESAGATTGSRSPTTTVIEAKGTLGLCDEIGIAFQSFDEASVEWETFEFDGMTWSGGLAIPKLMRSDAVKILLPCCKTHVLADYTFSLKLAAGLPPRSRRGIISDMHTSLQEKVVDINMGFTPDLIVMDALECFIDGGPDSGTARSPGLIVVGTDRVALDAVGVAILKAAGSTSAPIRGKIFETRQLTRAVEIGLGVTSPDEIELIGNDDATLAELRSILDMG